MPRLQPLSVFSHAGPGKVVKSDYPVASRRQGVGEIATDKATAAGNQDRSIDILGNDHATNPRLASSAVALSTLSSAIWPERYSASSCRPRRNSTSGVNFRYSALLRVSAKQCLISPARYLPVIIGF